MNEKQCSTHEQVTALNESGKQEVKACRSCKHWEGNAELLRNGPTGLTRDHTGDCYNEKTQGCMHVWENKVPDYIKLDIQKRFVTTWDFGCTNWEEAEGWEVLWQ
jgi:hypothetical protein